ncbi:ABC transporter permease subunit [Lentibacillus sp. N15]|uniref:ABC transporter permease n=1 Tax=Lentibacillus songyuanensis TaxID=3136161 RepID=UPI0031BAEEF9
MHSRNRLKKLFKHPYFLGGFIFLALLISASLIHGLVFHGKIPVSTWLYNNEGQMIAKGPFNPLDVPPLGTDPIGQHIFFILLQGAKYTIGIAVLVAALRVIVSSFVGLIFGDFLSRLNKYISGLVNGFYFIPTALLCYILLFDVIVLPSGFVEEYSFMQKVVFELIILTVVAIPTTSLLIGNQVNHVYKEEYITTAKTLGGGRFHLLKKHVLPYMWPRLLIQFIQEIVQVLVLLIHLGVFHVLFGGTLVKAIDDSQNAYISVSSEWSGVVGKGLEHLGGWTWNFFGPMIAFMLVILAFNFMIKGMEDVLLGETRIAKKTMEQPLTKKDAKRKREAFNFAFIHDHGDHTGARRPDTPE